MKPKMVDIGRVYDAGPPTQAEGARKQQRIYDSIRIDASDFPALAKAEVGSEIQLIALCRKTGENEEKRDGKQITALRIEIHKLGEVAKEERDILKDMGYRARG
jgi:hypothetical protein